MSQNSLFYSTAEKVSKVYVFNDTGEILYQNQLEMRGKEFSELLNFLDIAGKQVGWSSIACIFHVSGPHSFTGWRISSLTGTTIARSYGIQLFEITLFEYLAAQGNPYPIYIEANTSEVIIQESQTTQMTLISVEKVPPGIHTGIGWKDFGNGKFQLQYSEDLPHLWRYLQTKKPVEKLETLYLKRPNITLSSHGR